MEPHCVRFPFGLEGQSGNLVLDLSLSGPAADIRLQIMILPAGSIAY